MKAHRLKTWPEYFQATLDGHKPFDVRLDDRSFMLGDTVILQEWDPHCECYSGRELTQVVTYKLDGGQFGVEIGYCVLGLDDES